MNGPDNYKMLPHLLLFRSIFVLYGPKIALRTTTTVVDIAAHIVM